jgi:precorrin-6B methylase 2
MASSLLLRLFSFAQTIVFQDIGNKFPTKSVKPLMDLGFIIFEKMGVNFPVIADIYLKFYDNVVKEEAHLASISSRDQVLVIGSGSLPATPILIARHTGARVVTIDRDPTAVKIGTRFIHNINLDKQLTVAYGEGLTYPAKDFTVVFLMYGVKNTQAVIDSLPQRISDGCRVVIRLMSDEHHHIVDPLDLTSRFTIKNQVHTTALGSFDTFLLEKKHA